MGQHTTRWPLLALLLALPASATTWWVAVSGNDRAAGSQAAPFRTITHAAEVAQPGDTVQVRAGVYRETITPRNSGQPGAPIIYRPAPGEKVTISGAEPLVGWQPDRDGLYRAPMAGDFYRSALNYADQVFVDGQMVNLARWPNTGLDLSAPAKSTLTRFISKTRDKATNWTTGEFEDDSLTAPDGAYVGAEIYLQPNKDAWSWTLSGTVTAQQGKRLTFRSRNDCGQDGKQDVYAVGSRYYLFNHRALLDAPGEWYHDKAAGQLYLRTPAGDDPGKHQIEARCRDFAFVLDGRSYVTIEGFELFACTITTDAQAGDGREWDEQGNDRYPWRRNDSLPTSHHIVLDGLDARYVSHFTDVSGHFFLQWGSNTGINISGTDQVIQNCHVRYSAGNGIVTYGRRNRVLNNLIEDTAYAAVDNAFISTLGGAGAFDCEIAYNTGRRTGRSGIGMRQLQNSDVTKLVTRVHHNDIGFYMLQDADGGGTYTFGQDAKFARIDHNWFHDGPGPTCSGVYTDYSKNWIIDHNVIWNVEWGIHLEGAHDSGMVNGLCYNNTIACRTPGMSWGLGNGVMPGLVMRNNIANCSYAGKIEQGAKEIRDNLIWDRKPGSETDPRWVDAAGGNYQLSAASPARDKGSVVPSYSTLQPGNPDIVVAASNDPAPDGKPDLGAYEFGQPAWTAGCTLRSQPTRPDAPSGLTARAASATRVDLSWTSGSSNESGFVVERRLADGAWQPVATVAARTTWYYDAAVARSSRYEYRVCAVNAAGRSLPTKVAQVTTPAETKTDARIGWTATAPVIDGEEDACWASAPRHAIANAVGGNLASDADLSGNWRALWSPTGLYLLIDVTDDKLVPNPATAWYSLDAAEVYLDADNSKGHDYDGVNDYQFAFVWGRDDIYLGGNSAPRPADVRAKARPMPGGYRLEFSLPWAGVLGSAPKAGSLMGLDVHITDSDDGTNWKGKRAWFGHNNELWLHPDLFGTVELAGP